jgi:hypothetical protein
MLTAPKDWTSNAEVIHLLTSMMRHLKNGGSRLLHKTPKAVKSLEQKDPLK